MLGVNQVSMAFCDASSCHIQASVSSPVRVLQRDIEGRTYYEFEFATKANTYIRHALAVVTVANGKLGLVFPFCKLIKQQSVCPQFASYYWHIAGKFYTLTTGSNENRWEKMKQRLVEVVKSFQVSERYTG